MNNETCRGETKAGEPCESPFVGEDGFCPAHGPGGPEEMRERGRRGAQASLQTRQGNALDLPPLVDHATAETWADEIGRAVATGRVPPSAANAALRAVREWREAHDAGKVSDRLEALMDALSEWRATGDPSSVLSLVDGGGS